MHLNKAILIILMVAMFSSLKAQQIELYVVNIKGIITDANLGEPIPYAQVINPRVHGGTSSDYDGNFSINMLTEDTLLIRSMGYVDYMLTVKEFPPKPLYEIKMTPKSQPLNEVTIYNNSRLKRNLGIPESKPLNVPIELRSGTFNEKPPLLAAFLSPISYLTYKLNQEEKSKRAVLRDIQNGKEWDEFSVNHNLETVKRLTGLEGDEADEFMIYCNMNNQLPYNATEMQIDMQILDLYFKFKKLKSENANNPDPATTPGNK